jgi:hypothetical protein
MVRKKKGGSMFIYLVVKLTSSLCRQLILIHPVCVSAVHVRQSDSRCENKIWKSNKLNIFSPSIICHAEVFSKDLLEGGSVTMSVTKTWDLEWGAENNVERNSIRQK